MSPEGERHRVTEVRPHSLCVDTSGRAHTSDLLYGAQILLLHLLQALLETLLLRGPASRKSMHPVTPFHCCFLRLLLYYHQIQGVISGDYWIAEDISPSSKRLLHL